MAAIPHAACVPPTLHPVRFPLPTGVTLAADRREPSAETRREGAPAIVFLHGGGQTRHAWGGSAEALARAGFTTFAVDHRGHGESTWAEDQNYHFTAFRDDLLALLPLLPANGGTERPILVGASLGGIASMLAEAESEGGVCSGLVLVDVTPRLERAGVVRIIEFMRQRPDGYATLEEVADAVAAYQPHRKRPRNLDGLTKNLRQDENGRYRWHWDPAVLEQWHPENFDRAEGERIVAERLEACRRVRSPTLLIRGRMSDVVSEHAAQEFLQAVPHAEYVDLKGAAHMVAGDRNDAFTDTVADFITRHASSARS